MNRTLSILLSAALLLTACAPPGEGTGRGTEPVEVMRETSTPPPTQTPIPTPTFHPAFVDLQSRLADLGLTLLPDGTIETTADGGRRTVPNLLVSPEGIISLTLKDGTVVTVTPEDMSVDEAGGLKIKGYEWDSEQGGWVEAMSQAMRQTTALLEQYNIDLGTVTVIEEGGAVNVVDNETGRVLVRTIEGQPSKFDLGFAVDTIAPQSCEPTPFKAHSSGRMLYSEEVDGYLDKLKDEFNITLTESSGHTRAFILLKREDQCWGFVVDNDLLYRDADHVARRLPLIYISDARLREFMSGRYTE